MPKRCSRRNTAASRYKESSAESIFSFDWAFRFAPGGGNFSENASARAEAPLRTVFPESRARNASILPGGEWRSTDVQLMPIAVKFAVTPWCVMVQTADPPFETVVLDIVTDGTDTSALVTSRQFPIDTPLLADALRAA